MLSYWRLFLVTIFLLFINLIINTVSVSDAFVSIATFAPNCKVTNIKNTDPPPITLISGIPVVEYQYMDGIYIGPRLNPLTASTTAIDNYGIYLKDRDQTAREIFLNNTNWLVEEAVSHGNYSLLEYDFPWHYDLKPPWHSAMTQAVAMQALIRAHEETGQEKYLDTAKRLLNSFFVEVKDGGVTYKTVSDGWWYELYPSGNQSRVLNGMTYTLIGLYDYYQYTHDPSARALFDLGVTALKKNLPLYEYEGNYSNYDILGTTNPLGYHKAHIETLCLLYEITKEELFKEFYIKWRNFEMPYFLQ